MACQLRYREKYRSFYRTGGSVIQKMLLKISLASAGELKAKTPVTIALCSGGGFTKGEHTVAPANLIEVSRALWFCGQRKC